MMTEVLPAGTVSTLFIKTPFLALNQIPVQAEQCGTVPEELVRDVMYCLFVHCEVGSPYPIPVFTHGSIWLLRQGKSTRPMLPFARSVRLWSAPASVWPTSTPIRPPFSMMILRTCGHEGRKWGRNRQRFTQYLRKRGCSPRRSVRGWKW